MARIFSWLLDAIAPRRCLGCDCVDTQPFCALCEPPARPPALAIAGVPVFAAGLYEGSLKAAIRRFKYDSRPDLASPLAALLIASLPALAGATTPGGSLVPVPLAPGRLVERGYNQAALLARALARLLAADSEPRLLERVRSTRQQARLEARARRENMQSAFSVRPGRRPERVVLVDDVVTTGATVQACLEALDECGIRTLAVIAIARAERGVISPERPTTEASVHD